MNNTSLNNKKVAVLVHSCDRYELLYKGFETFFNINWNNKINTNNYFATEKIPVAIKSFENIHSGRGEWSNRLIILLKEKIKEDYIIYMQEDMWLSKSVDCQIMNQVIDFAINNSVNCIKLHSSEVYKTNPTETCMGGLRLAILNNKESKYLMSHQITLWKKSFLLEQLKANEHPWRNERRATKRMKKSNPILYQIDLFAENGKKEINNNLNDNSRSEYQTISVNGILNNSVKPFIAILRSTNKDYADKLIYNLENSITHDGKAKPRKEDIFKKLKRYVKNMAGVL